MAYRENMGMNYSNQSMFPDSNDLRKMVRSMSKAGNQITIKNMGHYLNENEVLVEYASKTAGEPIRFHLKVGDAGKALKLYRYLNSVDDSK
jgi:hypothetical protein